MADSFDRKGATPPPAADVCNPRVLDLWSIDHHEAGHVIVEFMLHGQTFHPDATLTITGSQCPGTPGGSFDEGSRRGVDVGIPLDDGGPQLDEVWGYLAGPCAEWLERRNRGCRVPIDDWLVRLWSAHHEDGIDQDDLSLAALNTCTACPMTPPAVPNCDSWTELHVRTEVMKQAKAMVELLSEWWDGIIAIVAAIEKNRSSGNTSLVLGAADLGTALANLRLSPTAGGRRFRDEWEDLNNCWRDGRMACQMAERPE
jgi:hypothetical protein